MQVAACELLVVGKVCCSGTANGALRITSCSIMEGVCPGGDADRLIPRSGPTDAAAARRFCCRGLRAGGLSPTAGALIPADLLLPTAACQCHYDGLLL